MVVHTITWPWLDPFETRVREVELRRDIEFGDSACSEIVPSPRYQHRTKRDPEKNEAGDIDLIKGRSIQMGDNRMRFPRTVQPQYLALDLTVVMKKD